MSQQPGQPCCVAGIANCRCDIQLDLGDGVFMCFVRIPKGEFLMGSREAKNHHGPIEEPAHRVVITQEFWLATTPVTQQQFAVWEASVEAKYRYRFSGDDLHPAGQVTWYQAAAFCQWLTGKLSLAINNLPEVKQQMLQLEARLPTEAQWEYACGACQTLDGEIVDSARRPYTEYHTGDGVEALSRAGWFNGNSGGRTHPVAQKVANRHGLHDMHGNVWEWCRDAWSEEVYCWRPQGVSDPVLEGNYIAERVRRGGSYRSLAELCRAAYRFRVRPDFCSDIFGFRVGLFLAHVDPAE